MRSRAQIRMRHVLDHLLGLDQDAKAQFADAVRELGALLHTNGLGQTTAYLKGNQQNPGHRAVYRALEMWLCGDATSGSRYPERCLPAGDLYARIIALRYDPGGRAVYMAATESAWRLCETLKPLAVAYATVTATRRDATVTHSAVPARTGA